MNYLQANMHLNAKNKEITETGFLFQYIVLLVVSPLFVSLDPAVMGDTVYHGSQRQNSLFAGCVLVRTNTRTTVAYEQTGWSLFYSFIFHPTMTASICVLLARPSHHIYMFILSRTNIELCVNIPCVLLCFSCFNMQMSPLWDEYRK